MDSNNMAKNNKHKRGFATDAIHVGSEPNLKDGGSGDVVVPIHLSTTFARSKLKEPTGGYAYSRSGNPTRAALEKNLAVLENGTAAFAYSSGLAAITNVALLLKSGDHVLCIDDVYGGTRRIFTRAFEKFGVEFTFAEFINAKDAQKFIKKNTKMIWIETPTNPLMKIVDIASVSKSAKDNGILTVVDNTFCTPYFQKPLDLGADIVVHSMTKYLSGHSDVTAGSIIVKDSKLAEKIGFFQNAAGCILSPFDSYSVLRGIKTLELRMQKHDKNTMDVVEFLSKHKKVKKVYHPTIPTHPGHEVAIKQASGFGGTFSFELVGDLDSAIKFMESLRLIYIAESLGDQVTLINHPATMTHADVPPDERKKIGIADTLLRLSIGIEDAEDLIGDLSQALDKI